MILNLCIIINILIIIILIAFIKRDGRFSYGLQIKSIIIIFVMILLAGFCTNNHINSTEQKMLKNFSYEIESLQTQIKNIQPTIIIENKNKENSNGLYYGRLFIPELNINVALYSSNQQYITDNKDSANFFYHNNSLGPYIGDHNTQEFSKLSKAKLGMTAYVINKEDIIIELSCINILNGYNTGYDLIDEKNNVIEPQNNEYLIYTCRNPKGVLITIWSLKKP